MIRAQVPGIAERLVQRRTRRMQRALELQYRDAAAFKHDDIGAPRVAWQLILEDRRVLACGRVAHGELGSQDEKPDQQSSFEIAQGHGLAWIGICGTELFHRQVSRATVA
mgnify:CR=1 FL=1